VIKLLGFHSTLQWQDYEQFQHEIKILKSLNDDRPKDNRPKDNCSKDSDSEEEPTSLHIPRYLGEFALEFDSIHWVAFVQEEIPGASLQTLLGQHCRFSEAEIRQIAIDLLQILIDLHEQYPPILHRDIKPDNVILTPERSVYLVDFGTAQLGAATQDITAAGTDGYAPLEQLSGQTIPASDLYAVGATVVHLLTGVCPTDLPQHQLKPQFRSFVSIDDRFTTWLEKMLEPDTEHRFRAAKQALTDLFKIESEIQSGFKLKIDAIETISNSTNHSIQIIQHEFDRIQINQRVDRLQVNIRKRGIHLTDALWLGTGVLTGGVSVLMLFSHVHPVLSLLCWLDSLPLLGIGLISALGEASLTLNDRSLSIQWKCLGISYRQIKQPKPAIAIEPVQSGITIQTETQQYSIGQFSPELSESEAAWLAQAIRKYQQRVSAASRIHAN
jgi:serine/threonine protein kinase